MYLIRNQRLVEEYHQPLYTTMARGVGNNGAATTDRGSRALLTAVAVMGLGGLTLLLLTHRQRGTGLLGL